MPVTQRVGTVPILLGLLIVVIMYGSIMLVVTVRIVVVVMMVGVVIVNDLPCERIRRMLDTPDML